MPERYFDVGIAEQQARAVRGRPRARRARARSPRSTRPSCSARFDQIVHDVCLQKLPVVFAMDRAGLVGDDGPTHHGVFDIAYLRCLPNITLMAPRDEAMLVAHAAHRARARRRPGRASATRAARRSASPLPDAPRADRDRHRRDPARGRARRDRRLRHRRRQGARRRRPARRGRPRRHRRRRALRQAARHRAARRSSPPSTTCSSPSRRACSPGGFGTGVWEALSEGGAARRASCASGCRTATSPTARRSCCTPRSASRPSASPSASRPPCSIRAASFA